jgi:hypothetical protein
MCGVMRCSRLDTAVDLLGDCVTDSGTPLARPMLAQIEPWTCGFRPPGFVHDHDWYKIGPDMALAGELASLMSDCRLASDVEVAFFPFVGQLDIRVGWTTSPGPSCRTPTVRPPTSRRGCVISPAATPVGPAGR